MHDKMYRVYGNWGAHSSVSYNIFVRKRQASPGDHNVHGKATANIHGKHERADNSHPDTIMRGTGYTNMACYDTDLYSTKVETQPNITKV